MPKFVDPIAPARLCGEVAEAEAERRLRRAAQHLAAANAAVERCRSAAASLTADAVSCGAEVADDFAAWREAAEHRGALLAARDRWRAAGSQREADATVQAHCVRSARLALAAACERRAAFARDAAQRRRQFDRIGDAAADDDRDDAVLGRRRRS